MEEEDKPDAPIEKKTGYKSEKELKELERRTAEKLKRYREWMRQSKTVNFFVD